MKDIIMTILSSAFIAACVSGLFSTLQSEKANYLKHVTSGRADWRKKIRKIATFFPNDNPKLIKKQIVKLEPYLNPYGRYCDEEDVLSDSHIWRTIGEINDVVDSGKQDDISQKVLMEKTSLLKEYLMLLLKHDWERSRREVRTPWCDKLIIIISVIIICWIAAAQLHFYSAVNEFFYLSAMCFLLFPMLIGVLLHVDFKGIKVYKILIFTIEFLYFLLIIANYAQTEAWQWDGFCFWIVPLIILATILPFAVKAELQSDIHIKYKTEVKRLEKMLSQKVKRRKTSKRVKE